MSLTATIRRERARMQAENWRRRTAQRTLMRRAIAYNVLILGSLAMIGPFAWMVATSLKQEGSVFIFPPVWIPHPVRWDNYVTLFNLVPFGNAFVNSIIVATAATVGQVLSSSLAAYAFARLRFRGRNVLFIIFLATMMVPSQVTLIPTFILFRAIGWINTLLPLTVPAFFGSAFGIFLLRQFFLTLPRELFEAAVIDGASPPHMYWRLALPLAKPALATSAHALSDALHQPDHLGHRRPHDARLLPGLRRPCRRRALRAQGQPLGQRLQQRDRALPDVGRQQLPYQRVPPHRPSRSGAHEPLRRGR
jgi:multiple sugar transport system permease protein